MTELDPARAEARRLYRERLSQLIADNVLKATAGEYDWTHTYDNGDDKIEGKS